jgi:NADPH:quinone reductase-like Zn-dependent oxidoreductase
VVLVRAAGVDRFGAEIRLLDLPEPAPRAGEVLLRVRACGVGNWDEFVRTGGWDTGARPPMALGVEAAGTVEAVGAGVGGPRPGDAVTTHSLPAGSWAEKFIAAVDHIAPVPPEVPMTVAAALPVPALTADQALDAVTVRPGETVVVHGAGGVTGGVLVRLAARRGARVIATAGRPGRLLALGAVQVLDYHDPDWPERVRALTSGSRGGGADAAVNAARAGSADAVRAVRDGGRLATITADLPQAERGIALSDIVVAPDGARLARLVSVLAPDAITVAASYSLADAAAAMARLRQGTHGAAVVLEP